MIHTIPLYFSPLWYSPKHKTVFRNFLSETSAEWRQLPVLNTARIFRLNIVAKENKTVDFRTFQEISKSFSDLSYSKGVSEKYSNTYRKYLGSLSCKFLTWTFLLHFYFDEKYNNLDLYWMARHTLYLAWGLDRDFTVIRFSYYQLHV